MRALALLLPIAYSTPLLADAFPDTVYFNGFEPCVGVQCAQVICPSGQTTSVTGTVFAPNGTLPLPNVQVYVPSVTPGALVDGPGYDRCDVAPLGHPIAAALTDANGNFTITNMPATAGVPLVMLAGKWRRQITIANVPQCTNTPLAAVDTRLPRNQAEGAIPHVAIVTGSADATECLMRKTGIDDTEFSTSSGGGRIHLFAGGGGANKFSATLGGASFADATTLWASSSSLSAYDQLMFGCEGAQVPSSKPATAISALKTYADAGGRVYLSHWQNIWIGGESGNPSHAGAWPSMATWDFSGAFPSDPLIGTVDSAFPQGATFSTWLFVIGASASAGSLAISGTRQTAITIDSSLARRWIYLGMTSLNEPSVQYFSFTTPAESAVSAQLGRVGFSDMHNNLDVSNTSVPFPSGCGTGQNAQVKALLYATFDLQRCVGSTRE